MIIAVLQCLDRIIGTAMNCEFNLCSDGSQKTDELYYVQPVLHFPTASLESTVHQRRLSVISVGVNFEVVNPRQVKKKHVTFVHMPNVLLVTFS